MLTRVTWPSTRYDWRHSHTFTSILSHRFIHIFRSYLSTHRTDPLKMFCVHTGAGVHRQQRSWTYPCGILEKCFDQGPRNGVDCQPVRGPPDGNLLWINSERWRYVLQRWRGHGRTVRQDRRNSSEIVSGRRWGIYSTRRRKSLFHPTCIRCVFQGSDTWGTFRFRVDLLVVIFDWTP